MIAVGKYILTLKFRNSSALKETLSVIARSHYIYRWATKQSLLDCFGCFASSQPSGLLCPALSSERAGLCGLAIRPCRNY